MPGYVTQRKATIVAVVLALCFTFPASGQTVDRIESFDLSPGQSANLTAYGKGLTDIICLWTPFGEFPGKAIDEKNKDLVAAFEGVVPSNLTPGVYATRVVTNAGVSSAQFIVVDDLPSFRLPDACEANPPQVTAPNVGCINGQINPLKPKFFGLNLMKNQTVCVEVFARRIDSPLDPILKLSDSQGPELVFIDDTPGLSGDAQFQFTAPADGRYVLELSDVKFSGGGSHMFHLRIGSFPLTQATFPRRVSDGQLAFVADQHADIQATVAVTETLPQSIQQAAIAGVGGSALATVIPLQQAQLLEVEPNNEQVTATLVDSNAAAIAGRIQAPGDVDWYRIAVGKPQHLCVTAHTRKLRSPADLVLEIYDSASKKLQSSDDTGQLDAQLSVQLPAAEDYFLCVKDLSEQGGAAWTYDLDVDYAGRLEVSTKLDRIAVPRGGTVAIPIQIKRLGASNPFQLSVVGLPEGLESSVVFVSPQQTTAVVALYANSTASAFKCTRLQLQAALSSGKTVPVVLSPASADSAGDNLLRYQTGLFAYPAQAAAYSLASNVSELTVAPGSEVKLVITATRSADWSHPIEILSAVPADQLPTGITIETTQIAAKNAEVLVKASNDAIPGRYSVSLTGTSTHEKTVVVQAIPTIQLVVSQRSPLE